MNNDQTFEAVCISNMHRDGDVDVAWIDEKGRLKSRNVRAQIVTGSPATYEDLRTALQPRQHITNGLRAGDKVRLATVFDEKPHISHYITEYLHTLTIGEVLLAEITRAPDWRDIADGATIQVEILVDEKQAGIRKRFAQCNQEISAQVRDDAPYTNGGYLAGSISAEVEVTSTQPVTFAVTKITTPECAP